MKKKVLFFSAGVLFLCAFFSLKACSSKREIEFRTAVAHAGSLQIEVTATGFIQPVFQVEVGTQVSGIVQKIYVDYNSQVEKGQLLAELDKSTLSERLLQSKASVSDAQSNLEYAQQNFDRVEQLYKAKAATQVSYEEAVNRLNQARNSMINAQANLKQAEVNLSYADIYSPISGRVLNREVEEGQTVAASFSTPTLFSIANDMTKMQVEANVDEADIGQVKPGQTANFTVDAYPGEIFQGTVSQVRLQATVTSNVVTYVVIIEAPNPEEKLFPGMTANVTIVTKSSEGLLVPSEALYFQPDSLLMKDYLHPGSASSGTLCLWVMSSGKIMPKPVVAGTTDGISTIIHQGLKEGDEIILSAREVVLSKKNTAISPFSPPAPGNVNPGRAPGNVRF